jgi:hypothetical protein
MKLIITREDGSQLMSLSWNGGELKIGSIIEQYGIKYEITKFIEIQDHYLIFNGVEL